MTTNARCYLFVHVLRALTFALLSLETLPAPRPPAADSFGWHEVRREAGIVVRRAETADARVPWGYTEAEIAAPLARVAKHLLDFPLMRHHVPHLAEVRVLSQTDRDADVYFYFDLPWPISNRDYTVQFQHEQVGDERFVMVWREVPSHALPRRGTIRLQSVRGMWELTATSPTSTHARYFSLIDVGGKLPQGVIDQTLWRQGVQTITGIRQVLCR